MNLEPIKKKDQEFVIDNLGDDRDDLSSVNTPEETIQPA